MCKQIDFHQGKLSPCFAFFVDLLMKHITITIFGVFHKHSFCLNLTLATICVLFLFELKPHYNVWVLYAWTRPLLECVCSFHLNLALVTMCYFCLNLTLVTKTIFGSFPKWFIILFWDQEATFHLNSALVATTIYGLNLAIVLVYVLFPFKFSPCYNNHFWSFSQAICNPIWGLNQ